MSKDAVGTVEHAVARDAAAKLGLRLEAPSLALRELLKGARPQTVAPREEVPHAATPERVSPASLRRDATYRRMLACADILAVAGSFGLVALTGAVGGVKPAAALMAVAVVVFAKLFGLYDRDELVFHKSTLDEVPGLFKLSVFLVLMSWLLAPVLLFGGVGRGPLLLLWGSLLGLLATLRFTARQTAKLLVVPERCLIVGRSTARMRFASKLAQAHSRIRVVGYLPLDDERRVERRVRPRWTGRDRRRHNLHIEDLDEIIERLDVHRVIVIAGGSDPEEMLDSIGRAKTIGVKVSIVPRLFEVVGSSVEFDDLEGLTVLGLRRFGLTRSSSALKRSMDVVGAALLLLVLSPVLAAIALWIRLDTRGPAFFRQARIGRDGRAFQMVKFRSMVVGAEQLRPGLADLNEAAVGLFKIADDPRVTRAGRLLRRAHLDELPQLVNVLRGEMSLVGPRPLVADEDVLVEGRHRGRLRLVPGMTGPWQLLGPTRVSLNEMVTIDYLYGANWSLWNDVKILMRTAVRVLDRRGL